MDTPVLATVSAGGVLGALTRYAIGSAWPTPATGFPWATWTVNVSGCLLMGILMTTIARRWPHQRFIRPFFGVGLLGGYTTFSTSIVDLQHTPPAVGLLYLAATVIGALTAVRLGAALAALGSTAPEPR
ncbi:fluoride efflux transporter FluC [Micromonosporaceae bacterium Da 78-11]